MTALFLAAFAVGVFPEEGRAAPQNVGACRGFIDSSGVILVEGVARYLPKSNQANYHVVATDLRDILVELAKRDHRFGGYLAGQMEAHKQVRLGPTKETRFRDSKVLASAASFSFARRSEAGSILVCHTGGRNLTIAAVGQVAALAPILRSIAKDFLKADRIAIEGKRIWPPEKGFKP